MPSFFLFFASVLYLCLYPLHYPFFFIFTFSIPVPPFCRLRQPTNDYPIQLSSHPAIQHIHLIHHLIAIKHALGKSQKESPNHRIAELFTPPHPGIEIAKSCHLVPPSLYIFLSESKRLPSFLVYMPALPPSDLISLTHSIQI